MALAYDSYFKTIPTSYKVNGAVPIDLRQVVNDLDNLYGQVAINTSTWINDNGRLVTYTGMLVTVKSNQEVYMCIDGAHPYLESSWKKISAPDVDISGEMVDIVRYPDQAGGDFYNKADGEGEGDQWHPNQGAQPITDSTVTEAGKYLCLEVGEDKVYINSKDLIDLDGYVTEQELNASLNNIKVSYILNPDSSFVNTSVNIDSTGRIINASIGIVTARIEDAADGSNGLATALNVYHALQSVEGHVFWEDDINPNIDNIVIDPNS